GSKWMEGEDEKGAERGEGVCGGGGGGDARAVVDDKHWKISHAIQHCRLGHTHRDECMLEWSSSTWWSRGCGQLEQTRCPGTGMHDTMIRTNERTSQKTTTRERMWMWMCGSGEEEYH